MTMRRRRGPVGLRRHRTAPPAFQLLRRIIDRRQHRADVEPTPAQRRCRDIRHRRLRKLIRQYRQFGAQPVEVGAVGGGFQVDQQQRRGIGKLRARSGPEQVETLAGVDALDTSQTRRHLAVQALALGAGQWADQQDGLHQKLKV
ncbi:hypothetical protein [Pseudomonas nitroreducens]|uniref:hypothetical protein n=1 Tax=Pseudomonas nitroreducens TaxID=46680 RepID=UPI00380D3691